MRLRITGVYAIENLVNDKKYIGSGIDCPRRWREHKCKLRKNRHHSKYLQNAWNKYGEENFRFIILEECTEPELHEFEQFWIDHLHTSDSRCGYNSAHPVKQHAPSKRMTEAHEGYWNGITEKRRQERTAHFKSEEFKAKATEGKRQESHRKLVSAAVKKDWQRPEQAARKEALRERFNGFKTDLIVRGKISHKAKQRWTDNEYRERGLKQIGEASRKAAEILKADPVKYAERLALLAAGRAAAAAATKARWNDPEFRARRIAQMKLPRKRRSHEKE